MTLAFHYHIPVSVTEVGIYLPGYLGTFLDGLAINFEKIICYIHSPLLSEMDNIVYKIKSSNIEVVNIGPHRSMVKRVLQNKKFTAVLEADLRSRDIDLFLFRAPSPLLPYFTKVCIENNIKYSYLIVGDYVKNLKGTKGVKQWKRFILSTFYKYNKFYQDKYIKNALVFTNNPVTFYEYKKFNTYEIRTTTLSEKDFFEKEIFYENKKLNLLYTGRIEPLKGIEDILLATKFLKDDGINVVFNLVGWDDSKGEAHLNYLKNKVKKLFLNDNFIFHGKKRVGQELFSMYRQSDIFISSTRGDEGFPRTIWEAMANSCLVIASKAGSIPIILEHEKNSLLVNKQAPNEIKESIKRLMNDDSLVKRLRKEALFLAKTNTIEKQSLNMINKMKEYLK